MSGGVPGTPLVFGEVLFDRFPDGSVVLGGAPFNVAWNLQALGLPPLFVSRVGRDELGGRIAEAMADWGMTRDGLQTDPERPTGTVEVQLVDGEPRYEILADRAYDRIAAEELPPVRGTGLIYHGTLALRLPLARRALDRLRAETGAPVLVDANLRDPWWNRQAVLTDLRAARWVKLNADELARLVPDETSAARRAGHLLGRDDLEAVLVTRGEAGASVFTRDGQATTPPPPPAVTVVDTVGAGDAFAAVALLGLARGWSWPMIMDRAQRFAAAVVALRGATTADRNFYARFTDEWKDD